MKPVRVGEDIVIDADTLKIGKTLAFCSVDIKHKNTGALIAQGKHTKYVGWKTKRRLSWDDEQMLTKWCEYSHSLAVSISNALKWICIYMYVLNQWRQNSFTDVLLLWESGLDKVFSTPCLSFKALNWTLLQTRLKNRGAVTQQGWHCQIPPCVKATDAKLSTKFCSSSPPTVTSFLRRALKNIQPINYMY